MLRLSELLSEPMLGCLTFLASADNSQDLEKRQSIIYTMATCHSLRVVDDELLGDPLDVKMFQFTGWSYEEGGSRVSEQPGSKYDTIMPSIAKPPVPAAHITNPGVGTLDVSYSLYSSYQVCVVLES